MKKLIVSILFGFGVVGVIALVVSRNRGNESAGAPASGVGVSEGASIHGAVPAASGAPVLAHVAWAQSHVKELSVTATPQRLRGVMGEESGKTYGTRIKCVHALDKSLSPEEHDALYAVLYDKGGLNMRPGQMHAFKNDIANILGAQDELPSDLSAHLILMYSDRSQDNVWRDYCIQHLSGCLDRAKEPAERKAIQDTLWKATDEKGRSIAGTALIALRRSVNQPDVDKSKVAARALELVTDPKCGHLAKITALQMCAELGEKVVLPTAREIADSGSGVPLRMSAIAAIGTVGGKDDKALLDKYAASSDVRLRKSARSALSRLGR
jgi:hypothetical protein